MTTSTKQINENDILPLPKTLEFYEIENEVLVIASDCGNTLGLFNANQVEIFKNLQQYSIANAERMATNQMDFHFVVAQILDREFFDTPLEMCDEYDTAQIYLTNACNLSCPHCYMDSGRANENELDSTQWFELLDRLVKHGIKEVIFSGGEILLHKQCLDIIKYAKNLGMIVRLKSNGVLWKKEWISEIVPFIDDIQISIDGVNEEMNAKVRGASNFKKALSSVEEFLKCGAKVIIATTPTYENIDEMEAKFVDFATNLLNKYGDNLKFIVSQKMLGGRGIAMKYGDEARQYAKKADFIMQKIYPNYTIKNLAINMEKKQRVRNCGYGNLSFSSNGNIYLCNRVDELKPFANINDDLGEVLRKAKEFNKQSSVDFITPCKDCSVRYICGGGCRIDEYSFRGRQELLHKELTKKCDENFRAKFKQSLLDGLKYIYAI
ncbi:radical SAM protein [Helicobacter sp. T3_23-1059]